MADEKERHSKVYNHAEKKKSREKPKKEAEHKEPDGDEGEGDGSLATGAADEMGARHIAEQAEMDKAHKAEMDGHADNMRKMSNRHISARKAMAARQAAEMGGGAAGPPDEGGEAAPPAEPPAPAV